MRIAALVCAVFTLLLAACAPAQLVRPASVNETVRAEVLVFRASRLYAIAGDMIFGVNGREYAKLANKDYVSLQLPAGRHTLLARDSSSSNPFTLNVDVKVGQRVCVQAEGNPNGWIAAIFPIAALFMDSFVMALVPCPSELELRNYNKLSVTYL
jgi:hypothetical protein